MLKPGVRVLGMRPELVLALALAQHVCAQHGAEFVITSVMEGAHTRASIHYAGGAADLRRPIELIAATTLVTALRSILGEDYDVILESDHIHVEFQPKRSY